MYLKSDKHQTHSEEIVNASLHGIGVFYSLLGFCVLMMVAEQQANQTKIIASALFGSTLVFMFLTSTIYHSVKKPTKTHFYMLLDHISIYLLIAGGMTPFALITLKDGMGENLLIALWVLAFIGTIYKLFFFKPFCIFSTPSYLFMGWLPIIAVKDLYHNLTPTGFEWLLAGGICYTIGVIFYHLERILYCHAIWHIFVIAGSYCHFVCILNYVILR